MHSTFSDGSFKPEELVEFAHQNQVTLLSLTDHDELGGLRQMKEQAEQYGIQFVTGVEVSTEFANKSIHIVGLNFDENNHELNELLKSIRSQRDVRAKKIAHKLEELGFHGALAGVQAFVSNPNLISRSHFAKWLVQIKAVETTQEAFDKWLNEDRPAYVPIGKVSVKQAVKFILNAQGIPVLAHPGRYKLNEWQLQSLLDEFKQSGGKAIEVATGSHRPEQYPIFAKIAREQGFWASCGSDFHSLKSPKRVGEQGQLDPDLDFVWNHF